jgi:hypothetical protein
MSLEQRTLTVKVVDENGRPLPGASVRPTGLRTREERGSAYSWRSRSQSEIHDAVTDAEGRASISFPAHPLDNLTTGTVMVLVRHPATCPASAELDVDRPQPVKLARGTKVTLSTQHEAAFTALYADVKDQARQAAFLKWERSADGQSLTSHLPDGMYLLRLVALTAGNDCYFSAPFPLSLPSAATNTSASADGSIHLRFPLEKAASVTGALDPAVPRPIQGGWVVAHVTSPRLEPRACGVLFQGWYRSVDVAEDGSFTLPNLPPGTLEIVAGCPGYLSRDTSEKTNDTIHQAQLIGEERGYPLTIPMEATGSIRIAVQAPDGTPLRGAQVYSNPNQRLGRATSIVGARLDSENILRRQDASDPDAPSKRPAVLSFLVTTDATGTALISGLPPCRQSYSVQSAAFDMPITQDGPHSNPHRMASVRVVSGGEISVTVKMEPKGSTSLSAAIQQADRERRCRH